MTNNYYTTPWEIESNYRMTEIRRAAEKAQQAREFEKAKREQRRGNRK